MATLSPLRIRHASLVVLLAVALFNLCACTQRSEEAPQGNDSKATGRSRKGVAGRQQSDYLEAPSLESRNSDAFAGFLEVMRQKPGKVSEIDGKQYIFIDNSVPMFGSFRKGYYRIDNLSAADKLAMTDILLRMAKHMDRFDDIFKGPSDEEGIRRGMMMVNQWGDDARTLERELYSILGVR